MKTIKLSDIPSTGKITYRNTSKARVTVRLMHPNPRYQLNVDNGEEPNVEALLVVEPGATTDCPNVFAHAIHQVYHGVLRGTLAPQLRVVAIDGVPCEEEPFKRPADPADQPTLVRAQSARRIEN